MTPQVVRFKRLVPKRLLNLTTRLNGWWCDSANGWRPAVGIAPLVFRGVLVLVLLFLYLPLVVSEFPASGLIS